MPDGDNVRLLGIDVDGTSVVLREPDATMRVGLGVGEWAVTEEPGLPPVAVSGGRTGPDRLAFDVLFLETPHRLAVTCDLTAGTFGARFVTEPLHGPALHALRAPTG